MKHIEEVIKSLEGFSFRDLEKVSSAITDKQRVMLDDGTYDKEMTEMTLSRFQKPLSQLQKVTGVR